MEEGEHSEREMRDRYNSLQPGAHPRTNRVDDTLKSNTTWKFAAF